MTELFTDVSDEIKEIAEAGWKIAVHKNNPVEAARFLSDLVSYHRMIRPQKEIDFLEFYFNMQMEMMKNDNASSEW